METTITLPENISEITLGQYMKYEELCQADIQDAAIFNRRVISLFTDIPFKDTARLRQKDYEGLLSQITTALTTEAEFTDRFTMHGIEFGFVPNLDKITMGEFADLTNYGADTQTLHRTMAVLFRPVIRTIKDTYEIMPYKGTEEYYELMKEMPMNCVNGALVFFYRLANELQEATLKFSTLELQKEMLPPTTSKISAGCRRLRNFARTIYAGLTK